MRKRIVLWAVTLVLLCVTPGAAQLDSVNVRVYDRSDLSLSIVPTDFRGFRGDTVTFRLAGPVVDTVSGDTLDVDLVWTTDNPQAVSLNPETGFAVFNSRGQYQVFVDVVRIRYQDMVIAWLKEEPGATWVLDQPLTLSVGENATMCAFVLDVVAGGGSEVVTANSKSDTDCPDMGGTPLPVVPVTWTSLDPSVICFVDPMTLTCGGQSQFGLAIGAGRNLTGPDVVAAR